MTGSSALLIAALITLLGASAIGITAAIAGSVRLPRAVAAEGGADAAASRISGSTTALAAIVRAAILLFGSLAPRTASTGHAPWSNLHEFSAAFAFGLLAVFIGLAMRRPVTGLTPVVTLVAAALL